MDHLKEKLKALLSNLDAAGFWLAPLVLRWVLATEFWRAGLEKPYGNNGFGVLHEQLFWPLSQLSPETGWQLISSFEILAALALILGLGTRFFAVALSILTLLTLAVVPAGQSSMISHGSWNLTLIYLAMLLPLILSGPGILSIDNLLRQRYLKTQRRLWS
jgi:putative oxidoreductase